MKFTSWLSSPLNHAKPLLSSIDKTVNIKSDILVDSNVILSGPPVPHEPINRLAEELKTFDTVNILSPIILPQFGKLFIDQFTNQDGQVELILSQTATEYLWNTHPEQVAEFISEHGNSILKKPTLPNISIVIIDSTVWIGVLQDCGSIEGAIITESSSALKWAESCIEECKTESELVTTRPSSSRTRS